MLDTLIRGAKIVDGTGKAAFTADVGILDGMIEAVGNLSGAQAFETIEAAGRVLTPGFIDMHCHLRDPGQEYKEDIVSGTRAAAHGGFDIRQG